ncbi:uncharacterized protein LOC17874258 [Capsella rubella]|uniref:uncharacterized protein LOC17874258 n=1 Tax=Capsella rubella TaxID=81985 RepID=UPI000CD4BFF5|nr:uncharacterized protein LOC17874258 [Capsella rubella]
MSRRPRASWYRSSPPPQAANLPVLEDNDDEVVVLPPVDNSAIISRLNLSLVGRMFHRGGRSMAALVSTLPKEHIWDLEGHVRGIPLGESRFQFFFETEADLLKVLNKRPCHFNHWSFALERWQPHIGASFPDTMTFWIRIDGIPAEYWVFDSLSAFGASLGTVRAVDTTKGRIQVSVQADAPLKFKKQAQIPTGETVSVSLLYEKLHRWCLYCRRICHEPESCPLLDKDQRILYQKQFDLEKSLRAPPRDDSSHSRLLPRPSGRRPLENRQSDRSSLHPNQRDSSPSRVVRKEKARREAPYQVPSRREGAPPAPHRSHLPHQKHISDPKGKGKMDDVENDDENHENFSPRNRSVLRIGDDGVIPQNISQHSNPKHLELTTVSDSQATLSDPYLSQAKAKQDCLSPDYARDRPFRLTLQKKSKLPSSSHQSPGSKSGTSTHNPPEIGSSAKKSLNFNVQEKNGVDPHPPLSFANLSLDNQSTQRRKSWYEMTLEEEAENAVAEISPFSAPAAVDPPLAPVDAQAVWAPPFASDQAFEAAQMDDPDADSFGSMDDEMFANDDLLGEDLHASLQNQEAAHRPLSPPVAIPASKAEIKTLKSKIVSGSSVLSDGPPAVSRPTTKPSPLIAGPSKRSIKSPSLHVNSASRKIKLAKGDSRSPCYSRGAS